MSERTKPRGGRRAFLGFLRGPDPDEAPLREPAAARPSYALSPMEEAEVASRLALLQPGSPRIRDKARPRHLDRLLGGLQESNGQEPNEPEASRAAAPRRTLPLLPVIRPPGAVEERLFVERCDGCGACKEACPHGAITTLDDRHGPYAGTPTIVGRDAPCHMCADFPCVSACDRGALTAEATTTIAVAEIRQFDCMAWSGAGCSTCVERCPVGAIDRAPGRPRVNVDACTGCGICQHMCPAPRNAVLLVARAERLKP